MRYEELTAARLREWGRDVEGLSDAELEQEDRQRMGYALRGADGALQAIGGVRWLAEHEKKWGPDVHLLGWFEGRGRSIWVHRMAIYVLSALAAAGERVVWAIPDPTIPNAEEWLRRLGFTPRGDGVWRRELDSDCNDGRVDAAEGRRRAPAGQR